MKPGEELLAVQKQLLEVERQKLEMQKGCGRFGCSCLLIPLVPFIVLGIFFVLFLIAQALGLVH